MKLVAFLYAEEFNAGCALNTDEFNRLVGVIEKAQREARAEAFEQAAAKAEEYATTGSSHKATLIAKAIRELAKARP